MVGLHSAAQGSNIDNFISTALLCLFPSLNTLISKTTLVLSGDDDDVSEAKAMLVLACVSSGSLKIKDKCEKPSEDHKPGPLFFSGLPLCFT